MYSPSVSIIIPVYNTAPWLEECLDSIISQTFTDLEIICINDASTDNSGSIMDSYSRKDRRIKVISLEQNSGQSRARNIGLDSAQGEYIYFLDSDDYIVPNAIETMYNQSKTKRLDILYFDAESVFEDDSLREQFSTYLFHRDPSHYSDQVYSGTELLNVFLKNEEWTCSMPRQFLKASFIKSGHFRFQEGRIHEDELFAFQCAIAATRVYYSSQKLFCRRFRQNSTMTENDSANSFIGCLSAAWYINKIAHEKKLYDKYIKSYIASLNNRALLLYEKCKQDILLTIPYLNDLELLNAFYYFEAQQDIYCAYGDFSNSFIEAVQKYDHVYIYGAGAIARSVFGGLVKKQIQIDGFIVSKSERNPSSLEGQRIIGYEDFIRSPEKETSIVIIALKKGAKEVQDKLNTSNIINIFYRYTEK